MPRPTFPLLRTVLVFACLVAVSGCAHKDLTTTRNIGIGGASGAAIGTVATIVTGGCIPCAAAIGLGAGAAAGFIYDRLDNRTLGR